MIRAAIAGGTGYTAGELLRILVNHPQVEITAVLSSTLAGSEISDVHRDLAGDTCLRFSSALTAEQEVAPDVMFLALGHGLSRGYLDRMRLPERCKVIDLGHDFRTRPEYGGRNFVYGVSELNRDSIMKASNVANPGCFATAILLTLMPLVMRRGLTREVHIHAVTGSTGSGKSLSETGHFSYRDSNISVYKPFAHQHMDEIHATLATVCRGELPRINFVPMRGDFTRGIFSSIYLEHTENLENIIRDYSGFYGGGSFVKISAAPISMKEVVNTNKCLIHIEKHNGYLHFTTAIDNLLKGASGQAVQNMNLMCGLDEACGLKFKGSAF